MRKYTSGFTIVELLIVIIVIAVLAAITVVAYRGVNDRAQYSALSSDLSAAAKKMELSRVDNGEKYPSTLPVDIVVSSGNVVQLTTVTDYTKDFCINGYGPANKVMSYKLGTGLRTYLCDGATTGSPVGGAAPTALRGTNLAPDFSRWGLTGDISYNAGTKELVCGNTNNGSARSPIIRIDGPSTGMFSYEGMATVPSPARTTSGVYAYSQYRAADGTTPALNTSPSPGPYNGNGNAPTLAALNTWQTINFGMTLGPDIIYTYLNVACQTTSPYYTSDTRYKNPSFIVN